jgi:hypothetical protein
VTTDQPLSILLLADDQKGSAGTIHEHIDALRRLSRHRVTVFNPRGITTTRRLNLEAFDVVVIHYSLVVIWDDYLPAAVRDAVAAYDGLKVQFIQDEYRWVDRICTAIRDLGIHVLFSVVPEATAQEIYGRRLPNTEILHTLTGYVGHSLAATRPPALPVRPIDVGYRGRSLPYWLGRLGHEKVEIGRRFLECAAGTGLRCDIAWTESARIYGRAWSTFLGSCRTVLTSESGASIVDFDGSAEAAVKRYVAAHPTAGYEEVERDVLTPFLGGPEIATISPRVFEAAAHRTGLIMFPGRYSDIVEPWRHYIPLAKDFSNFNEVAERVRDTDFLESITRVAHEDLIASGHYSYAKFIETFDDAVAARAKHRHHTTPSARMLKIEELLNGRGYRVSTTYWIARNVILRALAIRYSLRWPTLRRLTFRLATKDSREDLLRLAVLTGVQTGTLVPATGPFAVSPSFDADTGRLVLTSRLHELPGQPDGATVAAVERAVHEGALTEIVWNHATVGQYVGFRLTPFRKRIQFDVGRYDAYGIYRFDELLRATRDDPVLLLNALRPLVSPRTYRGGDD